MKRFINSKSTRYFIFLTIILLCFELLFNCFSNIFENTTDRIRLKSAMFNYRNKTEVLFLGSSRFKDGISPKLFCSHLNSLTGNKTRGFNGAITGANIERLEFFFNQAVVKPGIEQIAIEISRPQLQRKKEDIESSKEIQKDWDTKIATIIENKSQLIKCRKSLRFDNLKNIPAILFADHMEGSELYKKGALGDLLKSTTGILNSKTDNEWQYSIISPSKITSITESDKIIYDTFSRIAKKAKQQKVKITFIIPPLVNQSKEKETTLEMHKRFQNLSSITNTQIFDFSSANINESYFRDKDSHLNKEGCHIFSSILAQLFAKENNLNYKYAF